MNPQTLGSKYDRIAQWWHDQHVNSGYGVTQMEKALTFAKPKGRALDVGCGAGGRFIGLMEAKGYSITGLDVSAEMIRLARQNHPQHSFVHQDICSWESDETFDLILAWDSLFHLPFDMHQPVLTKLSRALAEGGVLMYTFGNAYGEHTDSWRDDTFYYSSIGINENMQLLINNGLSILHLELDQYPQTHVYVIAYKPAQA